MCLCYCTSFAFFLYLWWKRVILLFFHNTLNWKHEIFSFFHTYYVITLKVSSRSFFNVSPATYFNWTNNDRKPYPMNRLRICIYTVNLKETYYSPECTEKSEDCSNCIQNLLINYFLTITREVSIQTWSLISHCF